VDQGRTPCEGRAPQVGMMSEGELSTEMPALLPRLWRFALRLAGDRHDAEDLVQRACVRSNADTNYSPEPPH
jgi:DNA-directed RNA polymerase specialized sigma24 family protein